VLAGTWDLVGSISMPVSSRSLEGRSLLKKLMI
jgi:hypothetical protein